MISDVILSRRCMVGPGGYFRPGVGPVEVDGAVTVSIDFSRPEPDPDMDPLELPTYWCAFEIVYGGVVIYSTGDLNRACGIDATNALLQAMRSATHRMELRAFEAIDGSGRYGDVIPYLDAIPKEWWEDMRNAGADPIATVDQAVIFQHADGRRVPGRIELGYPDRGYDVHRPSCTAWLEGLDDEIRGKHEADTPFQALQLAMVSMASRLRAFLAAGGRVLTPAGDADLDLVAMFGPLINARRP